MGDRGRKARSSHGGVEVDTQGDAFFVAFPGVPGALEAARAITEGLSSGPIRLRIGLHSGRPLLTKGIAYDCRSRGADAYWKVAIELVERA